MDVASLHLVTEIGYVSAGTLEFLVDGDRFFFLEMNTRIQVEHTVTEMITGIDLVQAQLRIAAGERLWFGQEDVAVRGHAIQCRINAEDPRHGFRPAPAQVRAYRPPSGAGIRIDSAMYPGYTIPAHYDSMVAKLIAHGEDREMARRRMLRALDEFVLDGPPSTIPFHIAALQRPEFVEGRATTGMVARMDLQALPEHTRHLPGPGASAPASVAKSDEAAGPARRFCVRLDGASYTVEVAELGRQAGAGRRERSRRTSPMQADGRVTSPMHGVVIRVPVEVGSRVEQGTVVCVIEAMKMENEVLAPHQGTVADLAVKVGDTVDAGTLLLRLNEGS
jgi:acetyl-CoA/propionyl-CoA carboxylase biotin carboxyl carrier protein